MDRSLRAERPDVDRRAADWVAAGLISPDQRTAICEFEERIEPAAANDGGDESAGPITMVAEIAGYLGGIVAVCGGVAIVGPHWTGLSIVGRLAIGCAIATIGLVVGAQLVRAGGTAANRLGGFAWVIAAGGLGLASGAFIDHLGPTDDAWIAVGVGLVVAATGTALWRNRDRPFQFATAAVGVAVAAGGLAELLNAPIWSVAVTTWIGGLVLGGAVAVGRVHPRSTGLVIAAVATTLGAFQLADRSDAISAVVAVATAAAIVAIALAERSVLLLAVGLVAFIGAVSLMMVAVVQGTLARSIVVVVGLIALALVGIRAQRIGRRPLQT